MKEKEKIKEIFDKFEKDHYCANHGDIIIESKSELSGLRFLIQKEFDELKEENRILDLLCDKKTEELKEKDKEIESYKATLEIYENPKWKKSLDKALKQKATKKVDLE